MQIRTDACFKVMENIVLDGNAKEGHEASLNAAVAMVFFHRYIT